jgi:DNA-binding transcriptional regulator PaaX
MKRQDFSRKIIKILAEKPAISLPDLSDKIVTDNISKYAITRSIKGLQDAGLIENVSSDNQEYARLTKDGKKKAHSLKLDDDSAILNLSWDGYWRMILLDLPENRKSEREALRYLLKKAGFVCIKNSVWVSMYPFEHLFTNIKKDLELTTEMMIIVTDKLDKETENEFLKLLRN